MQQQDVNKVIENLSVEYAQQLAQSNRKIALLTEQNERFNQEVERLQAELDDLKEENKEEDK